MRILDRAQISLKPDVAVHASNPSTQEKRHVNRCESEVSLVRRASSGPGKENQPKQNQDKTKQNLKQQQEQRQQQSTKQLKIFRLPGMTGTSVALELRVGTT